MKTIKYIKRSERRYHNDGSFDRTEAIYYNDGTSSIAIAHYTKPEEPNPAFFF